MKIFKNKKILITGATKGLGLICVEHFSKLGANIYAVGRDAKFILRFKSKKIKFIKTNFLEEGDKKKFFEDIIKIKNFDIIIHCLGGGLGIKQPLLTLEDFIKLFKINLGIASEINLKIFKNLNKKESYIIHIGSTASTEAIGSVGYNSIKAAIVAYVKSLAVSLINNKIYVSSILPGAFIAPGNAFERLKKNNLKIYNNFIKFRLPRKRIANANELIPLIEILCSKKGQMLAGTSITIDACETKSYKF
jgi:NAD(P)-dependent dehydrogenase (short-subunit alcohol dehydrogenase family)